MNSSTSLFPCAEPLTFPVQNILSENINHFEYENVKEIAANAFSPIEPPSAERSSSLTNDELSLTPPTHKIPYPHIPVFRVVRYSHRIYPMYPLMSSITSDGSDPYSIQVHNVSQCSANHRSKVNSVLPVTSPRSSYSNSLMKQLSYLELKNSKINIQNSLIRSKVRVPLEPSLHQKILAAIKIQSTYRMYKEIRKYEVYDNYRKEYRYLLMRQAIDDAEEAIENIYQSKEGASQLRVAEVQLDRMVSKLSSSDRPNFVSILKTLFSFCDTEKVGYISRSQVKILVLYVINLPMTLKDFCKEVEKLDPRFYNTIHFPQFETWFSHIKHTQLSIPGWFEARQRKNIRKTNIQYLMVKADFLKLRYISTFSRFLLSIYDRRNPPLFHCQYCRRYYVQPWNCAIHSAHCTRKLI